MAREMKLIGNSERLEKAEIHCSDAQFRQQTLFS
jgi:hypothetical protein